MSESFNPNPNTDPDDLGQPLPPLSYKRPDDDPPMEPNPYMGGGKASA